MQTQTHTHPRTQTQEGDRGGRSGGKREVKRRVYREREEKETTLDWSKKKKEMSFQDGDSEGKV